MTVVILKMASVKRNDDVTIVSIRKSLKKRGQHKSNKRAGFCYSTLIYCLSRLILEAYITKTVFTVLIQYAKNW